MVRRHITALAFLASALLLPAGAAEPPHYTFAPHPPGEIVQSLPIAAALRSRSSVTTGRSSGLQRIRSLLLVSNPCALDAALCCPTKPRASAYLRFKGGRWVEAPIYFALHAPAR